MLVIEGHAGVLLSDSVALWDPVHEFVTGVIRQDDVDRVLSTILFTDVVKSTVHVASLGDEACAHILDRQDRVAERCVERFRGRVVKTTGDGVLAAFDGPARGIKCATAIVDETEPLAIEVRAGLHTGE